MEKQKKETVLLNFSDETMQFIFNLRKEAKEVGLKRISPVIIFKCLLEERESIIYQFFCETLLIPYNILEDECDYQIEKLQKYEENLILDENNNIKLELLRTENENEELVLFTPEAYTILYVSNQLAEAYKSEFITKDDILIALIAAMPKELIRIFRDLGIDPNEVAASFGCVNSKFIQEEYSEDTLFLPEELKNFTKILNEGINKRKKCDILGRDKECDGIWRVLQKMGKRNVILLGPAGVGKSAIAKKITDDIVKNKCPEIFKNFKVISLNVNDIVAGTTLRGMAEERFKSLIDFIQDKEDIILFIDEIHMIMKAGSTKDDDSTNLANALKPILADSQVRVIGTTTKEEYKKHIEGDKAIKRRFEVIEVKEPKAKEVYPMLKNAISTMSKYHDVRITRQVAEYAVLIAGCFKRDSYNPDKTKDVIDEAMVIAKNNGKKYVDKESVLKVFELDIEKYNRLDKESRRYIAYHEAGHYIVSRLSEKLKDINVLAVSIIPVGDSGGVNIYEYNEEKIVYPDMSYYIDEIAWDFAGRVAEEICTGGISSGVASDSKHATERAYDIVTKYGMGNFIGKDRIYFDDETRKMFNDKLIEQINQEVDDLCQKGRQRAEEIINNNKGLLIKFANQLLEKEIMTKADLDKFFEKELKNN